MGGGSGSGVEHAASAIWIQSASLALALGPNPRHSYNERFCNCLVNATVVTVLMVCATDPPEFI
jgi:hypothetical protein